MNRLPTFAAQLVTYWYSFIRMVRDQFVQRLALIVVGAASCWPVYGQYVQQGSKLVGAGALGVSEQGYSVGLSGDSNTAIVGGLGDGAPAVPAGYSSLGPGAAWIFTRSGATWSQQGGKLVAAGGASSQLGLSAALSADGNTLVAGSEGTGAWVFVRSGSIW